VYTALLIFIFIVSSIPLPTSPLFPSPPLFRSALDITGLRRGLGHRARREHPAHHGDRRDHHHGEHDQGDPPATSDRVAATPLGRFGGGRLLARRRHLLLPRAWRHPGTGRVDTPR